MQMANIDYWIPTKPYSETDAVNRVHAATGSVFNAMASSDADYNGHWIRMEFNDYRQYWVASYTWGERVVVGRGDFRSVLQAAIRAFDSQGRGGSLRIRIREDKLAEAEPVLAEFPRVVPWSPEIEEAHDVTWKTWRHRNVSDALSWAKHRPDVWEKWREAESQEAFTAAMLAR